MQETIHYMVQDMDRLRERRVQLLEVYRQQGDGDTLTRITALTAMLEDMEYALQQMCRSISTKRGYRPIRTLTESCGEQ